MGAPKDRYSDFLPPLSKEEIIQVKSRLADLNEAALRDLYTPAYVQYAFI